MDDRKLHLTPHAKCLHLDFALVVATMIDRCCWHDANSSWQIMPECDR